MSSFFFFFFESRLGKRQFDCSEAEQGAEHRPPIIDQSPAQEQNEEECGVARAPGDASAGSPQGPVY